MKQSRENLAYCLWVAAFAAMTFGTFDSIREHHNAPALAWGIFLGLVAIVPSVWCVGERVAREREPSVLEMVELVEALHEERDRVTPLH